MALDDDYEDIINLPRPVSSTHPRMSQRDRAAQFSPFAALTGYNAKISETARLTGKRLELDEFMAAKIDNCLQILLDNEDVRPQVSITFFQPDERKSGGSYVTYSGNFRRIDEIDGTVVLTDGTKIQIKDIYLIEGDFSGLIEE